MFLVVFQAILKALDFIWQWIASRIGIKDEASINKKNDWNNPYDNGMDYFQPHFYNGNHSVSTNFRQRGLPIDVDRSKNQESQNSAVTLPRPFHAPVRQTAPNNLTNRAGNQKQKQSLVELLLEQQKEAALVAAVDQVAGISRIGSDDDEHLPERSDSTFTRVDERDNASIDEDIPKSILPSSIYRSPPLAMAAASPQDKGGLRNSRPIVKLNRMQFIAQMKKEGKDGERMGDYAPESHFSSVDLSSIQGALKKAGGSQLGASSDPATDSLNSEQTRMRKLSSAYPTMSLNDLSLISIIGGGGFGQVWKGTWGGTPVAVKLLSNLLIPAGGGPVLPEQEQLLNAFEEEVSMLAQLRHPNICLFLGVCLDPPHRAIVTELVSRGSLWDCLRIPNLFQQKTLPWPVGILRRVLEGTCRGLVYLHGHSPPIIHRDLKSANLLLDETFNVKICDFGLARLRDYNTVLTANVGTIHWMAPEVLTGNQYNESADIYSVGIVMWELFTGMCPYDSMKQVEVALSVVQRGLRPVIPTTCTTAQANIIRKCWDTDPSVRYTAEQLLAEVDTAFPMK